MIENVFSNFIDYDFLDFDCRAIEKYCYDLKKHDEIGIVKSNTNGWHSKQFFQQQFDETQKKLFINKLEEKLNKLSLHLNYGLTVTDFWININSSGSLNVSHSHPGSLLSGCFYVKVPEENSGNLVFENPIFDLIWAYCARWNIKEEEINKISTLKWYHQPKENKCIIFPSWLKHSVEVNRSNEDRISIAFNVGTILR